LAGVAAAALLLAGAATSAMATTTAVIPPTSPWNGAAQPGQILFQETFDSEALTSGPISIAAYSNTYSTAGNVSGYSSGYTGGAPWAAGAGNCNGWILNQGTPWNPTGSPEATADETTNCTRGGGAATVGAGQSAWWFLQQMAYALGVVQGQPDPATNNAVSAETNGSGDQSDDATATPPDTTQFIVNNATPIIPGHIYLMSVYVAAAHCWKDAAPGNQQNTWADPDLNLFAVVNGTTQAAPLVSGTPCPAPNSTNIASGTTHFPATLVQSPSSTANPRANIYASEISTTFVAPTGATTLGMALTNDTLASTGNDMAFDNPMIIDITPKLDKAISPAEINPGDTAAMTFIITNVYSDPQDATPSVLDPKPGLKFTDVLPTGVTLASTQPAPADQGTCISDSTNGTFSVDTSDPSQVVMTGDLAAVESCTIIVNVTSKGDVTAPTGQTTYENGPDKVSDTKAAAGITGGQDFGDADGNGGYSGLTGLWAPSPADLTVDTPILGITKVARPTSGVKVGDTVTYTFTVSNTGKGEADNVNIADAGSYTDDTTPGFQGSGAMTALSCTLDSDGSTWTMGSSLAADASATCTATYIATQADIDTMVAVNNTAQVTGTDTAGDSATPASATASFTPDTTASLTLDKTVDQPAVAVGGTATYSFTVTNNGSVTVKNIDISDVGADFTGVGTLSSIDNCTYGTTLADGKTTNPDPNAGQSADNGAITLALNETATCTATYVVQSGDLTSNPVANTAQVTGKDPQGNQVGPSPSSASLGVPGLSLTKDPASQTVTTAGDVTWTLTATNTGSAALTNVTVTDSGMSNGGTVDVSDCKYDAANTVNTTADSAVNGSISLDIGEAVECTATYTVTADDITAATKLTNTASASGTAGDTTVNAPDATATVDIASLSLTKDPTSQTVAAAGDVTWTLTAKNTGSAKLTGVKITDATMSNGGDVTVSACTLNGTTVDPAAGFDMAANDIATCTATYTVTSDDITAGQQLTNTASAAGTAPDGSNVAAPDATATVDVASLTLTKDPTSQTVSAAGDVTWTLTATNTGSVALHNVIVSDSTMSNGGAVTVSGCAINGTDVDNSNGFDMAVGDVVTCTATYTVTSDDITAGQQLTNTAQANGTTTTDPNDPANVPVASNQATATVDIASLSLVKSASTATLPQVGKTITYTFTVTNTGSTTLTNIAVNDSMLSAEGVTPNCLVTSLVPQVDPNNPAAGSSTTCTGNYTVKATDLNTGSVLNTATASGTDSAGDVINSSPASALVVGAPAVTINKSVTPTQMPGVGGTVTYTFTVQNTGTAPLYDLQISDDTFSVTNDDATCTPILLGAKLLPGQTTTCTGLYTIQQADVNAGKILNTATAIGFANPWCTFDANLNPTMTLGCTVTSSDPSSALVTAPPAPPAPGVPASTGGSVTGAMVLWPMLALMVAGIGLWVISWRRKLAA